MHALLALSTRQPFTPHACLPTTNSSPLSARAAYHKQTLVCQLGQLGKRFFQRSLAILILRELSTLWRCSRLGTGGRLKAEHHPVSMTLIWCTRMPNEHASYSRCMWIRMETRSRFAKSDVECHTSPEQEVMSMFHQLLAPVANNLFLSFLVGFIPKRKRFDERFSLHHLFQRRALSSATPSRARADFRSALAPVKHSALLTTRRSGARRE